jgi:hypothetical protein
MCTKFTAIVPPGNAAPALEPAQPDRNPAKCARLRDGRVVRIRPSCSGDLDALRGFFAALSPETLRLRFLFPVREVRESTLREFATADDRTHVALVAEPWNAAAGQVTNLIAEARWRPSLTRRPGVPHP